MLELGQILGLLAAVVLVGAIAAWTKLGWNLAPLPAHGRSAAISKPAEFASRFLLLAFGLSVLAALFAVAGSIGF